MSSPAAVVTGTAALDAALRALADDSRRAILDQVRERPRAVGEIAQEIELSQQAVSHHLAVLRRAGLVSGGARVSRRVLAPPSSGSQIRCGSRRTKGPQCLTTPPQ